MVVKPFRIGMTLVADDGHPVDVGAERTARSEPLRDDDYQFVSGKPAPKKRKASTSPTARSLAELRKRGWPAQVVEQHLPYPKPFGTKRDLFGVIDIVAIVPIDELPGAGCILGIQATSALTGGNHAARRDKILAELRAKSWVEAGGRLELWSWSKRGGRGARKLWTLRVEAFTRESWEAELPPAFRRPAP